MHLLCCQWGRVTVIFSLVVMVGDVKATFLSTRNGLSALPSGPCRRTIHAEEVQHYLLCIFEKFRLERLFSPSVSFFFSRVFWIVSWTLTQETTSVQAEIETERERDWEKKRRREIESKRVGGRLREKEGEIERKRDSQVELCGMWA